MLGACTAINMDNNYMDNNIVIKLENDTKLGGIWRYDFNECWLYPRKENGKEYYICLLYLYDKNGVMIQGRLFHVGSDEMNELKMSNYVKVTCKKAKVTSINNIKQILFHYNDCQVYCDIRDIPVEQNVMNEDCKLQNTSKNEDENQNGNKRRALQSITNNNSNNGNNNNINIHDDSILDSENDDSNVDKRDVMNGECKSNEIEYVPASPGMDIPKTGDKGNDNDIKSNGKYKSLDDLLSNGNDSDHSTMVMNSSDDAMSIGSNNRDNDRIKIKNGSNALPTINEHKVQYDNELSVFIEEDIHKHKNNHKRRKNGWKPKKNRIQYKQSRLRYQNNVNGPRRVINQSNNNINHGNRKRKREYTEMEHDKNKSFVPALKKHKKDDRSIFYNYLQKPSEYIGQNNEFDSDDDVLFSKPIKLNLSNDNRNTNHINNNINNNNNNNDSNNSDYWDGFDDDEILKACNDVSVPQSDINTTVNLLSSPPEMEKKRKILDKIIDYHFRICIHKYAIFEELRNTYGKVKEYDRPSDNDVTQSGPFLNNLIQHLNDNIYMHGTSEDYGEIADALKQSINNRHKSLNLIENEKYIELDYIGTWIGNTVTKYFTLLHKNDIQYNDDEIQFRLDMEKKFKSFEYAIHFSHINGHKKPVYKPKKNLIVTCLKNILKNDIESELKITSRFNKAIHKDIQLYNKICTHRDIKGINIKYVNAYSKMICDICYIKRNEIKWETTLIDDNFDEIHCKLCNNCYKKILECKKFWNFYIQMLNWNEWNNIRNDNITLTQTKLMVLTGIIIKSFIINMESCLNL